MPHIRKAWLICDKCEKQIEIDPAIEKPFSSTIMQRSTNYAGWLKIKDNHILCDECAKIYTEEKRKCDEHLNEVAGIKTVTVEI
jgi:hypothetical protein